MADVNEVFDEQGRVRQRWDTATRTYTAFDENGELVFTRPFNETELEMALASDQRDNHQTLDQRADAALNANKDYLALTSRTNAQVAQQVVDLTRQMNGVIRLLTGRLDATD